MRTGEWLERNDDAGKKLGRHLVEVEIDILDLTVRIERRKFAEHARHVEVCGIGAGHDLVERHLQHIARLRFLDIDGSRQRVRSTAGKIGACLFDLFDRRARNHLVVAVHHGFENDGVAGFHPQHRRLATVEPTPLGGVERCRQQMHPLAVGQIHDAELGIGRPDPGIAGRGDRRRWRKWRRGSAEVFGPAPLRQEQEAPQTPKATRGSVDVVMFSP